MATALAHAPVHEPRRPGTDLRVAVDAIDLDAALADALRPHLVDARVGDVICLDAYRTRRPGTSAHVHRNRIVAVLVAVGLALVLAAGATRLAGAASDAPPSQRATVVVQPGQTLWDVATEVTAPGHDVRVTMQRIQDVNGLAGTSVPAWTTIVVPPTSD